MSTPGPRPSPPGFRDSLRAAASASATPYGYTVTVWSSGTVSMDVLGHPHLLQVLLFMAGAVAGFLLVEAAAYGSTRVGGATPEPPAVSLWAHAHWLSAGVAIVLVWTVVHAVRATGGWGLAGLVATAAYVALSAAQTTLAAQR